MAYLIHIWGLANGEDTPCERKWVKSYDPNGRDGQGLLEVCDDPDSALVFPTREAAIACWNQQAAEPHALRPDGKPNKPMTAFTCAVVPAGEAV